MNPTTPCHHPLQCILPPHMVEAIKMRGNPQQRKMALEIEKESAQFRLARQEAAPPDAFRGVALEAATTPKLERRVYDGQKRSALPGTLIRSEGDPATGDVEADQAYDGAGDCFRLYSEVYQRNSLDGQGLILDSTVHHRSRYNNAFWNGSQMAYGDGDGMIFKPLTGDLSVIGHELSHGVVQFSGGLIYQDQSGALNEHIADVFGVLTTQYKLGQDASAADWLVGSSILAPGVNGQALRSLKAPGTAYDDNLLGKDPQPYHMDEYVNTSSDNGGVHINSGIPNQAFYLLAMLLGGRAWEKAGHIWYDALQAINNPHARFADWAEQTVTAAWERFGTGSFEGKLTRRAWKMVGIHV